MAKRPNLSQGFASIPLDREINRAVVAAWNEAVEEFGTATGFDVVRSAIARALLNERQACINIVQRELMKRDLGAACSVLEKELWDRW